MPKPHTFPILYDDLKTISIQFLTKHGYLKPNQWQNGTLNWSRNGNPTGSISIKVCTMPEYPFIELEYKYNENPMNYKIQLVCAPSNLGKGVVWFFVCPLTGKRCRKLYLANSFFIVVQRSTVVCTKSKPKVRSIGNWTNYLGLISKVMTCTKNLIKRISKEFMLENLPKNI